MSLAGSAVAASPDVLTGVVRPTDGSPVAGAGVDVHTEAGESHGGAPAGSYGTGSTTVRGAGLRTETAQVAAGDLVLAGTSGNTVDTGQGPAAGRDVVSLRGRTSRPRRSAPAHAPGSPCPGRTAGGTC